MHVIRARNINSAYSSGVLYLRDFGLVEPSRAGAVMVAPHPVTTVYSHPVERVLLAPGRIGNPVFHLMESIFMLAGRRDATWLDQFMKTYSKRFADEYGNQEDSYGWRWRNHFFYDQLEFVIGLLRHDPTTRQAVLDHWDPDTDLNTSGAKPCNTHVYFRAKDGILDMTVCNRSNDIIWGLYGANAVHFSVLHEYVATMTGLKVGTYYHISNNFHAYQHILRTTPETYPMEDRVKDPYFTAEVTPASLIDMPEKFDEDVQRFMDQMGSGAYFNHFFNTTLAPMANGNYERIEATDWKMACIRHRRERALLSPLKSV